MTQVVPQLFQGVNPDSCYVQAAVNIARGSYWVSGTLPTLTDRVVSKIANEQLSKWNWLWLVPVNTVTNAIGSGLHILAMVVNTVTAGVFGCIGLICNNEDAKDIAYKLITHMVPVFGALALLSLIKIFYPPVLYPLS